MAPTKLLIYNDTIFPLGTPPNWPILPPHQQHVAEAMLAITIAGPPIAGVFALLATKRWWTPAKAFSWGVLSAIWFLTIGIVGYAVYLQDGATSRLTFILAVAHGQVEVLMWFLLLSASVPRALAASWIWGFVLYLVILTAQEMSTVFIVVAIIAGANDFMITALLLYGKRYKLAIGAVGHILSAVLIFTRFVKWIPIVPYEAVVFIGLWLNLGPTVAGVMALRGEDGEAPNNPLQGVKVPPGILLRFVVLALIGTTTITLLLAYVIG
ncbi:hypothetical protein SISNIDRAFT_461508 [Sistotremastrum niveocremeum HHB9708]|uniref:Uncharacterized protein n=2 Tax=Sistotremastraceae TaxID=3402574 RepID=A0A164MJD1_9AGAM|nr:hypothetical protein SISNIDRAFT_461508 [Sistotremastrum niveocremeum HHB9708]KZT35980.1 hypothetical protein SISSUDRAFT_1050560 [Sistotremastrum suecicum HHB10207 ss-3]